MVHYRNWIILAAVVFTLIAFIPYTQAGPTYDFILAELQRLNIQVIGQPTQMQIGVPSTLSGPNWGLKKTVCEQGGYNLSPYAGKELLFTSYPINELWNNTEPLDVWVISTADQIACVYKAVRKNSSLVPGIFSVK